MDIATVADQIAPVDARFYKRGFSVASMVFGQVSQYVEPEAVLALVPKQLQTDLE